MINKTVSKLSRKDKLVPILAVAILLSIYVVQRQKYKIEAKTAGQPPKAQSVKPDKGGPY